MNNKVVIIGIIGIVLLGAGYWIYTASKDGGNKTNESENTGQDMEEATNEDKEKFSITGVTVEYKNGSTVTTGKVKNNDKQARTLSIQVKFYNKQNRPVITNNVKVENLAKGIEKDFTITCPGDYSSTDYTYRVEVEYIK